MVIDKLQPASVKADSLAALTTRLRSSIDTVRRGGAGSPQSLVDEIIVQAKALKKELPRAA